jgi:hypothetical protein
MLESIYIQNALHELRFRLKMSTVNLDRCILVHQMGKVGSSAIVRSLEDLNLETPVFHTHSLNLQELNNRISRHLEALPNNFGDIFIKGHLRTSKLLVSALKKKSKRRKWKIITLVREPISRNISAFFQNTTGYDNFIESIRNGLLDNELVLDKFLNDYAHNSPLEWLDLEIKDVFGLDLYQDDFPKSEGYKIYSAGSEFDIMVIRIEDLNHCHKKAFKEFLGIENFSLSKENISLNKEYSDIYHSFLKQVSIPSWYVDKMYSSKYFKHFYSDSEIENYRKKWLREEAK